MQRSNSCSRARGEGAEDMVVPGVESEGSAGGRDCGVGASLTAVAVGVAVTLACNELDT